MQISGCSMKTTLDLDDDLLARANELAMKEGTSLTTIIEESLAMRLRCQSNVRAKLNELPLSARTGGLRKCARASTA
jgi:predicted transcriptional regulator